MATQVQVKESVGAALLARFHSVRAETMRFVSPLSAEDMMVQSCAESSPVKWHLAHTSWFFETFVLGPFAPGYKPFHPDFHWLFNSYYNALGEMPEKKLRASFSRPSLEDVVAYRRHVEGAVAELLAEPQDARTDEMYRRIVLGLEHEQQHLELIATDIKHALFTNPMHPAYLSSRETELAGAGVEPAIKPELLSFSGGLTEIGVSPAEEDVEAFAFDNETPRHTVFLAPYRLASRLVTVAEYLMFMNDNGYGRPELWLSEGWAMMRAEGWQAPLYWMRDASEATGWKVYTHHGFGALDALMTTPVCHVSFFEADAFARWAGHRLATEFEWEQAAAGLPVAAGNMLESRRLHPAAAPSQGPSTGLQQMFGDVWEWTASGYSGYPGYRPAPGALGEYNGKFMSSQVILRGGSCVTPASHIRRTYRNFFPPGTRWQFSGIRLAADGL